MSTEYDFFKSIDLKFMMHLFSMSALSIFNRQFVSLMRNYDRKPQSANEYFEPSFCHKSSSLAGKEMGKELYQEISEKFDNPYNISTAEDLQKYAKSKVVRGRFSVIQSFLSKIEESVADEHKGWMNDPNDFLHYDENCQS